ncbi:hypothetical protein HYALB_00009622 [Hymenoscyphus albidus]|uniref:Uncharacterized protein n=1 Tax=Hymenoscyphus albidus TaxID=595503 RepID=A0A9N9LSC2_9HELO|nr:hypothetical protein HYALB_00009622 [Hymenoscyphus albidus]
MSIRDCSLASEDPSDRISYQLKTHVLTEKGLETEGNIWAMTERIGLLSLFNTLKFPKGEGDRLKSIFLRVEVSNGNIDAKLRDDIEELAIWATWSVIRCLHASTKYHHLVMVMYDWFKCFATINIGPKTSVVGENEIVRFDDTLSSDCFQANGSGIECFWILNRFFKHGCIYAGRLENADPDGPLTAVFDCDSPEDIFTPLIISLSDSVKLRQEPVSFIVVKQESSTQQQCCLAWNINSDSTQAPFGADMRREPEEDQTVGKLLEENNEFQLDLPTLDKTPLRLPLKSGMPSHPYESTTHCSACDCSIVNTDYRACKACDVTICNICHLKGLGCAKAHEPRHMIVLETLELPVECSLYICIFQKNLPALKRLLQLRYIKYTAKDKKLLDIATIPENAEYLRALLDAGLVHIVDDLGKTALHRAAEEGKLAIVNVLLEAQSDTTTQDNFGETPLHYAAENGHLAVVQCLCEHVVQGDIRDRSNRSAYICANSNNHAMVCEYLESQGLAYL